MPASQLLRKAIKPVMDRLSNTSRQLVERSSDMEIAKKGRAAWRTIIKYALSLDPLPTNGNFGDTPCWLLKSGGNRTADMLRLNTAYIPNSGITVPVEIRMAAVAADTKGSYSKSTGVITIGLSGWDWTAPIDPQWRTLLERAAMNQGYINTFTHELAHYEQAKASKNKAFGKVIVPNDLDGYAYYQNSHWEVNARVREAMGWLLATTKLTRLKTATMELEIEPDVAKRTKRFENRIGKSADDMIKKVSEQFPQLFPLVEPENRKRMVKQLASEYPRLKKIAMAPPSKVEQAQSGENASWVSTYESMLDERSGDIALANTARKAWKAILIYAHNSEWADMDNEFEAGQPIKWYEQQGMLVVDGSKVPGVKKLTIPIKLVSDARGGGTWRGQYGSSFTGSTTDGEIKIKIPANASKNDFSQRAFRSDLMREFTGADTSRVLDTFTHEYAHYTQDIVSGGKVLPKEIRTGKTTGSAYGDDGTPAQSVEDQQAMELARKTAYQNRLDEIDARVRGSIGYFLSLTKQCRVGRDDMSGEPDKAKRLQKFMWEVGTSPQSMIKNMERQNPSLFTYVTPENKQRMVKRLSTEYARFKKIAEVPLSKIEHPDTGDLARFMKAYEAVDESDDDRYAKQLKVDVNKLPKGSTVTIREIGGEPASTVEDGTEIATGATTYTKKPGTPPARQVVVTLAEPSMDAHNYLAPLGFGYPRSGDRTDYRGVVYASSEFGPVPAGINERAGDQSQRQFANSVYDALLKGLESKSIKPVALDGGVFAMELIYGGSKYYFRAQPRTDERTAGIGYTRTRIPVIVVYMKNADEAKMQALFPKYAASWMSGRREDICHELTHLADDHRIPMEFASAGDADKGDYDSYANNPKELNAWFVGITADVERTMDNIMANDVMYPADKQKAFNVFLGATAMDYVRKLENDPKNLYFFPNLSEVNKKKLRKRLAQFWVEMHDKFKKMNVNESSNAYVAPSSKTPSEPGYLYHATNTANLDDIKMERMVPHAPDYGTDQDAWPDGSTDKRSYFVASASSAYQFAPEHGQPVLLRVKRSSGVFHRESTGDWYTVKAIEPNKLEVLTTTGWIGLNALEVNERTQDKTEILVNPKQSELNKFIKPGGSNWRAIIDVKGKRLYAGPSKNWTHKDLADAVGLNSYEDNRMFIDADDDTVDGAVIMSASFGNVNLNKAQSDVCRKLKLKHVGPDGDVMESQESNMSESMLSIVEGDADAPVNMEAAKKLLAFILKSKQYVFAVARPVALYKAKKTYDAAQAPKLARYTVVAGGKAYMKGSSDWHQTFNPKTRDWVAEQLIAQAVKDAASNKYDAHLPKKYRKDFKGYDKPMADEKRADESINESGGIPRPRFLSIKQVGPAREWQVVAASDSIQALKGPMDYGGKYYDTENKTWVQPGKRGPVTDKRARSAYKEVPGNLDLLGSDFAYKKTKEEYAESMGEDYAYSKAYFDDQHKCEVVTAYLMGRDVPANVVAQYKSDILAAIKKPIDESAGDGDVKDDVSQAGDGDIYKVTVGGKQMFSVRDAVANTNPRGFGDTLHDSPEKALTERDWIMRRRKENKAMADVSKARNDAETKAENERKFMHGFLDGGSAMARGRAVETLNKMIRTYDGKVLKRKDYIYDAVKNRKAEIKQDSTGDYVSVADGKVPKAGGGYQTGVEHSIGSTKVEVEFAKHLIKLREQGKLNESAGVAGVIGYPIQVWVDTGGKKDVYHTFKLVEQAEPLVRKLKQSKQYNDVWWQHEGADRIDESATTLTDGIKYAESLDWDVSKVKAAIAKEPNGVLAVSNELLEYYAATTDMPVEQICEQLKDKNGIVRLFK